jgi:hypothetical protein
VTDVELVEPEITRVGRGEEARLRRGEQGHLTRIVSAEQENGNGMIGDWYLNAECVPR